jgi:hypothetical protein
MTTWLNPSQISEIFTDEITTAGGKVTNTFEDEGRLFTRSVLCPSIEVAPGDKLKGGVALRATDDDIFIHPYVFRIVCTNGAIMAQATQTRHIPRDNWYVSSDAEGDLETTIRVGIRRCCEPAAFVHAAGQMRSSKEMDINMAISMASFITGHRSVPVSYMTEILRRYDRAADRSAYGFMNAVTSVARDTADPEMKWRLEELGGGVPAALRPRTAAPLRARSNTRSLVEVG